jgi:hypothetical protein
MTDDLPWSMPKLLARIDRRLDKLGLKEADLVRKGKVASTRDWRRKLNKISPQLRNLEKWAAALGWSLPELLGIEPERTLVLDHRVLGIAIYLAEIAIGNNKKEGDLERQINLMGIVVDRAYRYVWIASSESGEVFDTSSKTFSDILSILRDELRRCEKSIL